VEGGAVARFHRGSERRHLRLALGQQQQGPGLIAIRPSRPGCIQHDNLVGQRPPGRSIHLSGLTRTPKPSLRYMLRRGSAMNTWRIPATSGWLVAARAKNVPRPRPRWGGIDEHIAEPGESGAVGDQPGEASLNIVSGIKPQRQRLLDRAGHHLTGPARSLVTFAACSRPRRPCGCPEGIAADEAQQPGLRIGIVGHLDSGPVLAGGPDDLFHLLHPGQ
jgi:hypothetical protein